jgi:hypothetical protein
VTTRETVATLTPASFATSSILVFPARFFFVTMELADNS